jgi:hypothetical protein
MQPGRITHRIARLVGVAVLAAGLFASIGCGLDIVGTFQACPFEPIVRGTPTEPTYELSFRCDDGVYGAAKGSYDQGTGRVEEKASNDDGDLVAVWNCGQNPWTSNYPNCRLVSRQANYRNTAPNLATPPGRKTYTTFVLADHHRATLSRLTRALPREQPAPAPAPAPMPTPRPTKPDLMVTRVSGPTTVNDQAGIAPVYEIVLANDGTPARNTAQVQISFAGRLTAAEMVDTPAGFTCERNDYGFACVGSLGGIDDAIQTRVALFKAAARATGPGDAWVYGSANHDRALDEMTVDNNLKLLDVAVE